VARAANLIFVLDATPATEIPQELIGLAGVVTANSEEAHAVSGPASAALSTRLASPQRR
jgi:sugar/nucleoside kinase (ribokinase family)